MGLGLSATDMERQSESTERGTKPVWKRGKQRERKARWKICKHGTVHRRRDKERK